MTANPLLTKRVTLETEFKTMFQVIDEAKLWFRSKRPAVYSLQQHIEHPTINCNTERERQLATAIALWLKIST